MAWSLCNQLLLKFSMYHFETMHICCGYIEDVHANFCREKIIFDEITAFWTIFRLGFNLDWDNFQVGLQYWVESLCNQLLPEFSSNQFETFHRCYKHIEDVHVTLSRQENIFFTKLRHFGLRQFSG